MKECDFLKLKYVLYNYSQGLYSACFLFIGKEDTTEYRYFYKYISAAFDVCGIELLHFFLKEPFRSWMNAKKKYY